MTEKRYSHDGVVIIDHLKKDLIYIDGKENLLELAEYVDKLQNENEQLKQKVDFYKYFQKDARELEEENERLKKELSDTKHQLDNIFKYRRQMEGIE